MLLKLTLPPGIDRILFDIEVQEDSILSLVWVFKQRTCALSYGSVSLALIQGRTTLLFGERPASVQQWVS